MTSTRIREDCKQCGLHSNSNTPHFWKKQTNMKNNKWCNEIFETYKALWQPTQCFHNTNYCLRPFCAPAHLITAHLMGFKTACLCISLDNARWINRLGNSTPQSQITGSSEAALSDWSEICIVISLMTEISIWIGAFPRSAQRDNVYQKWQ